MYCLSILRECVDRRQSAEDDSIVRRIKMNEMKSKEMSVLSIDPPREHHVKKKNEGVIE